MKPNKIVTQSDLRAVLLASIEAVLEGRLSVPMANAVVGLAEQVHSSIRQQWDMSVYASENMAYAQAQVIKLIGSGE